MADASLPDERFRKSLCRVVSRLARRSGTSFSAAAGHDGRQAVGRWQKRSRTTVNGTLAGHYHATGARCQGYPMVVVPQDTTTLDYSSHPGKRGLGQIDTAGKARGLLAHTALAASTSGVVVGLLDLTFWHRDPSARGVKHERRQRAPQEKESWRWPATLERVQSRLPAEVTALLVQDREGDYFGLFEAPRRANVHWLVRVAQNRLVEELGEPEDPAHVAERTKLFEVASRAPEVGRTRVKVWRQKDARGRVKRQERWAEVRVFAQEVLIQPPRGRGLGPLPVRAWLVRSEEVDPPAGEEPVGWVLLTTWPVTDGRVAEQVVRWYGLRWLVERFHFVLKSGCRIERLQIQERRELERVLALHWLVAWRVMWVTLLARERPEAPAEEVLTPEAVKVLSIAIRTPVATARDVTHGLAKLAGAEDWRNAPEPGLQRIWTGLRNLDNMSEFYQALQEQDAIQG